VEKMRLLFEIGRKGKWKCEGEIYLGLDLAEMDGVRRKLLTPLN
jgi:hypothetical protein